MTENTTPEDRHPTGGFTVRVDTTGTRFVTRLTAGELDTISRQIECNVAKAAGDMGHPRHYAALARIAWVWEKRHTPGQPLDPFLALDPDQLYELLGLYADDNDEADEVDPENPTDSTPA